MKESVPNHRLNNDESPEGESLRHKIKGLGYKHIGSISKKVSEEGLEATDIRNWSKSQEQYSFKKGNGEEAKDDEGYFVWTSLSESAKQKLGYNTPDENEKMDLSSMFQRTWKKHQKFIRAAEISPSIIIITDTLGHIEYVNPQFLLTTGYDWEEVKGKGTGFLASDIACQEEYEQLRKAIVDGKSWKGELVNRKKNGETFVFSGTVSPNKDKNGNIADFVISGQDITSFRETEVMLNEAIEEKTFLLSELHHRVKNNLAIISGIMQLQAFSESDFGLQQKLFSGVGRIQTLASLHELLYETGSFSRLDFSQNIKRITSSVSMRHLKESENVKVSFDLEPVQLNINQAHPCSLIINEVITNTFRHAFHGVDDGELDIKMKVQGNLIRISIKDNGTGIPVDLEDRETKTLGYQLLETSVRQLGGEFTYEPGKRYGTEFQLCFEREEIKGATNARFI